MQRAAMIFNMNMSKALSTLVLPGAGPRLSQPQHLRLQTRAETFRARLTVQRAAAGTAGVRPLPVMMICALLLVAGASLASTNEINWWTFTGGGGKAEQGSVALTGVIGPIAPALLPATGGN